MNNKKYSFIELNKRLFHKAHSVKKLLFISRIINLGQ